MFMRISMGTSHLRGTDRGEVQMLRPCLDDYVAAEAAVRFMDASAESLNFKNSALPAAYPRTPVVLTLSNEFHTAPPLEHREHIIDTQGRRLEFPLTDYFTSKTTTSITIPSGSARLLSLDKPTGKPEFEKQDILQAIFITCDILRPEK